MVALTEAKRSLIDRWRSEGVSEDLLKAFEKVPREDFLPELLRPQAYVDQPLLIGHEQTISQPTTVINMLMFLDVHSGMNVLEIGSGSGYVCALLAALGCTVTGLEIVPELAVRASRAMEKAGFGKSVAIHAADGGGGWEESAPYDRILVSAAAPEVPRHLFWQLKKNGILVAPVGIIEQRMVRCQKKSDREIVEEDHGAYVFVPLAGRFGEGNMENSLFE
ncbi:MAG TPA: protein-L-isoaspartate(D-aspartate) O-methyltransferase [Candidatus Peribacterales bacterium]|nr:protein-L-isoaspartate(D-aspartate) O-methyltransferase [Candidatus Peribacterales bacterium]